jgi:hypothetical protein
MDHTIPFGIASAHYLLGEVADAVVGIVRASQKEQSWLIAETLRAGALGPRPLEWVGGEGQVLLPAPLGEHNIPVNWEALGVGPTLKWADDFIFFQFPKGEMAVALPGYDHFQYAYNLEDIHRFSAPLSIPWHLSKFSDFGFAVNYLGFIWNLTDRTVDLQEVKRVKYQSKIDSFLALMDSCQRVGQKLVESINGTLSHICFVFPRGKSFLPNLSHFASSFESRHRPRFAPPSVRSDMRWWSTLLASPAAPRSLLPKGDVQDLGIWCDASTSWGIGICIGGQWDAWRLLPGWNSEGRDIGWAESIAVELVVRALEEMEIVNANILVRCDNQGVIGAYSRGRSRNFQVNLAIRRVEAIGLATNVSHSLSFVESELNRADPFSRGEVGPLEKQFPLYVQLPAELTPFLVHV